MHGMRRVKTDFGYGKKGMFRLYFYNRFYVN